jgi:hypothetical protein
MYPTGHYQCAANVLASSAITILCDHSENGVVDSVTLSMVDCVFHVAMRSRYACGFHEPTGHSFAWYLLVVGLPVCGGLLLIIGIIVASVWYYNYKKQQYQEI